MAEQGRAIQAGTVPSAPLPPKAPRAQDIAHFPASLLAPPSAFQVLPVQLRPGPGLCPSRGEGDPLNGPLAQGRRGVTAAALAGWGGAGSPHRVWPRRLSPLPYGSAPGCPGPRPSCPPQTFRLLRVSCTEGGAGRPWERGSRLEAPLPPRPCPGFRLAREGGRGGAGRAAPPCGLTSGRARTR